MNYVGVQLKLYPSGNDWVNTLATVVVALETDFKQTESLVCGLLQSGDYNDV